MTLVWIFLTAFTLDPKEVVHVHLANSRVVSKNKDNKEFEDSIRVFIDKRQTKLDRVDSTSDAQILYEQLRLHFKDLCTRHNELKRVRTQKQHSSAKIVNRYRTVESPRQISKASGTPSQHQPGIPQEPTSTSSDLENQGRPALPRTRIPRHSQRYSFKRHQGKVGHEPPAWAKQLTWKAPKEMSDSNNDPSTIDTTDSKDKQKSDQAPSVGTLEANTKRVLSNPPDLQRDVAKCLQEGAQLAVDTKRKAQRLTGRFLETLRIRIEDAVAEARRKKNGEALSESDRIKTRREAVSDGERVVLDYICERGQKDADQSDLDEKADKCMQFLESFLIYLYSDNLPKKNSTIGKAVGKFIGILIDLELFDVSRNRSEINVSAMKDKGQVEMYIDFTMQENISAVENYITLNEMIRNRRRIVPITSSQQGFVTFSERDLALFLWKRDLLKQKLVDLASFDQDDPTTITSTNDLKTWIGGREPGFIIKHFVCDIDPTGLSNRQKRKTGHRAAISLRSLSEIRNHLQFVKQTNPRTIRKRATGEEESVAHIKTP
ncbi:hypothetical protein BGX30_013565 [Mortierella sp. GBA39]|nr:hypothetical protein BGX30_013565 [Mortierella sp. GBA39]